MVVKNTINKNSINVSDFVGLSSDEVIIKAFNEIELKGPRGKCYFVVTNYRLIYFIDAKEQFYNFIALSEYELSSISAIKSVYGKIANKIARIVAYTFLIMGLILLFLGLFSLIKTSFYPQFKNLALIIGGSLILTSLLLFIFGKNKVFLIDIKTPFNLNTEIKLSNNYYKTPFSTRINAKASKASFDIIHNLGKTLIEAKNYIRVENKIEEVFEEKMTTYDLNEIAWKRKKVEPEPEEENISEVDEEIIVVKEIL